MTGVEFAIAALSAWAWRKARRIAGRADTEIDLALDAGMDRLHQVVAGKLGTDPALAQLLSEARADLDIVQVRDITARRVQLAVQDAAEADPAFASQFAEVVRDLQVAQSHEAGVAVHASGTGAVAIGGHTGIVSTGPGAINIHR